MRASSVVKHQSTPRPARLRAACHAATSRSSVAWSASRRSRHSRRARPARPRPGLVAYAPVPLTHRSAAVRVTNQATVLAPGVALLPPLPATLSWDGAPMLERALVVNVRGVGLLPVSGCGHPGTAAMLTWPSRYWTSRCTASSVGCTCRCTPGPGHLPQALTGSPRPPWRPLSDQDIDAAVRRLRAAGASLVAVSGHDSTPHTMRRFAAAFDAGFREVQPATKSASSTARARQRRTAPRRGFVSTTGLARAVCCRGFAPCWFGPKPASASNPDLDRVPLWVWLSTTEGRWSEPPS
jgi:hypothetical protein